MSIVAGELFYYRPARSSSGAFFARRATAASSSARMGRRFMRGSDEKFSFVIARWRGWSCGMATSFFLRGFFAATTAELSARILMKVRRYDSSEFCGILESRERSLTIRANYKISADA